MSLQIISECCYSCNNCRVVKQICTLKNMIIQNVYKDKCDSYSKRPLNKCELCGTYVVNLQQHVKQYHKKTMEEYKIITKLEESKKLNLKGRSLF